MSSEHIFTDKYQQTVIPRFCDIKWKDKIK